MKTLGLLLVCIFLTIGLFIQVEVSKDGKVPKVSKGADNKNYWLVLYRKSNEEFLYFGEPGEKGNSALVKRFKVKTGIPGERPTPLPKLLGVEYWLIVGEYEDFQNPETAPYFLTLNIPVSEESPFGPEPYLECDGQCNWELPGFFGLHGDNGDSEKLSEANLGSSGCVRHSVEDITYLYNLLDPLNSQVRYYIDDV